MSSSGSGRATGLDDHGTEVPVNSGTRSGRCNFSTQVPSVAADPDPDALETSLPVSGALEGRFKVCA